MRTQLCTLYMCEQVCLSWPPSEGLVERPCALPSWQQNEILNELNLPLVNDFCRLLAHLLSTYSRIDIFLIRERRPLLIILLNKFKLCVMKEDILLVSIKKSNFSIKKGSLIKRDWHRVASG
jgi:hypothetical protein